MKIKCLLFLFVLIPFIAIGCSDSSSSGSSTDQLAIFAVSTSGNFGLQTDGNNKIDFCYEGEGCTNRSGGSFFVVFNGQRMDLDISSTDKVAVGAKVGLVVDEGEGFIQVVRGESFREDGFLEFREDEVVFESQIYSAGQTIQFEWGNTD